jgi:hypothetical protein
MCASTWTKWLYDQCRLYADHASLLDWEWFVSQDTFLAQIAKLCSGPGNVCTQAADGRDTPADSTVAENVNQRESRALLSRGAERSRSYEAISPSVRCRNGKPSCAAEGDYREI